MMKFAAVLLLVIATTAQSLAQSAPSLSLSPSVVILKAAFGQTIKQSIGLNNGTTQGLDFEMIADDVIVKNGKRVFVAAGELPHSIASTAVFSERSGHVAAGATQAIQVLLTIPDQTTIRAVAIYFRSRHVVVEHGTVSITATVGALITFILSDNIAVQADPVRVHAATASENLKIVETLKNTGSEPVVPDGVAAFLDASGSLVAKIPFQSQRLLPGEGLEFTAEYAGRLKPGAYHVLCTFSYEGKALTNSAEMRVR
ncbi:MAG: hypothetical protein WCA52_08850 [Candidatus Aquilonibacter sp.]|jgi:hypothetical protein